LYLEGVDPFDTKKWPDLHEWLRHHLELLHRVFAARVKNLEWEETDPASEIE